jgi:hypothetical protein
MSDAAALDPVSREFYLRVMNRLQAADIPFLVGGAYALERYTGIARHTKDFDLFVHPRDVERALAVLAADGCRTDLSFPHWLAKAACGDDVVDLIFSSGNGVALVDDDWFRHSVPQEVLGKPIRIIPPEEMIWSKSFVMERERYDGADVAHILRARGDTLDWPRLLCRFEGHWRVLLHHLVIFGFIYPCERTRVPAAVVRELMGRLDKELTRPADERVCQGTLISRAQYLVDVEQWGYSDPRLAPRGNMTPAERARWTAGIAEDGPGGLPVPVGLHGLLHSTLTSHRREDQHGADRAIQRPGRVRAGRVQSGGQGDRGEIHSLHRRPSGLRQGRGTAASR